MKLALALLSTLISTSAMAKSYVFRDQSQMTTNCGIQVVVTPFKDQAGRSLIEIQKEQYGNGCTVKCTMCEGSEILKINLVGQGLCFETFSAESKNAFINSAKMDGIYASDVSLKIVLPRAEQEESCSKEKADIVQQSLRASVDVTANTIYAEAIKKQSAQQNITATIHNNVKTRYYLQATRD